jgi:hypothetical protein
MALIGIELRRVAAMDAQLAVDAMQTIATPLRAYPVGQAGSGHFVLLCSFNDNHAVLVEVDVSGPEPTVAVERLELLADPNPGKDAFVARRIEELYPRIAPSVREGDHKRSRDRSVLFVGDPGRLADAAGPTWRQAVAAVCESFGFDVAFDVTPITNRAATTRQMDLFGGTAMIIATSAAGSFRSVAGRIPRWAHRTVELDRPQLQDLLDDLRLNFELGLVDPPHVETWDQFAERAEELEGEYFRLTNECKSALRECRYHDASRLWQFTQKLSEAARRRRVAGWNTCGPVAVHVRDEVGLEIALTDGSLGNTSFDFEGVSLSWEPHVKVDDVKDELIHLGRIYFAIDDENERFVVDHIGMHR